MTRHHDRIDTLLRMRAMRPLAGDLNVEKCPTGGTRARSGDELADRQPGTVVHAVDEVARETFEQPVPQHLQRAANTFLSRLENEVHRAVEVAGLRKILRRTQQHGGVTVMATGMHTPGVLA